MTLRQNQARRHALTLVAGAGPVAQRIVEQVRLAAGWFVPALLVGEPGAGKRTLARIIHFLSPGRDGGCAVLDCERLPAALLAGALFGDRPGVVPPATVYLREPGALPRELQARIAELLTRRAAQSAPPGPRVLAGVGRDLDREVAEGRLLESLRCALSPLRIDVPALRTRLDELPILVETMLERLQAGSERRIVGVTERAWEVLRQHRWPGNLSELYDVLQTAAAHAAGERIDVADLPASLRLTHRLGDTAGPTPERIIALDKVLEDAERRLIVAALRRARGNKTRAAELLAIWRPRLLRRMEALGLGDAGALARDAGGADESPPGGEEPTCDTPNS